MDDSNDQALFQRLMQLAREIARGDYGRAQDLFELTRQDADSGLVEELAESFGMMLVQVEAREFRLERLIQELRDANRQLEANLKKVKLLENIKSHLTKFVPQSVSDIIQTNPEAPDLDKRERDVSVLFLDVAGYTKMSEKVDHAEMNYLIERYFSAFLDDIRQNNGDINETAGDGLMIIFLADDPQGNAINSVNTAATIQKTVRRINAEEAGQHESVIINVGVNSGSCSVGSTRFEGVSGTRWTFTASGSVTNMAARLGALAKGGKIYIGQETRKRIGDRFKVIDLGPHELKNVSRPTPVFEVLPD
jgi:class 3 adenylate cyclase